MTTTMHRRQPENLSAQPSKEMRRARRGALSGVRIHAIVFATGCLATVAVAGASIDRTDGVETAKADRLPVSMEADQRYRTIEIRLDGLSILNRVPLPAAGPASDADQRGEPG